MINKINSNQNFQGIRLTHSNPFSTRVIVRCIKSAGYYCCGAKTVEHSSDKQFVFNTIRLHNDFFNKEFGVVFLPKEAYIVSSPANEQLILPIINKLDKGAHINFSL